MKHIVDKFLGEGYSAYRRCFYIYILKNLWARLVVSLIVYSIIMDNNLGVIGYIILVVNNLILIYDLFDCAKAHTRNKFLYDSIKFKHSGTGE